MKREDGFTIPSFLFITFSLSVMVLSIAAVINSRNIKIKTVKDVYKEEEFANQMVRTILTEFQSLKDEKVDKDSNRLISGLKLKYADNKLKITDISTSLNTRFLSKEVLNNKYLKEYCEQQGKEFFTEYGWINKQFIDTDKLEEIQKSFSNGNTEDLFPLVNSLPLYNVNYMSERFLSTMLNVFNVKESKKKATELFNICQGQDVQKELLAKTLGVDIKSKIMSLIGTKTTFWKISFETNKCVVNAVFAAVPYKNKDIYSIEKYIVIEKTITYKGMIKNVA